MNRDLRPVPVSSRTLSSVRRELERWRKDPARTRRIPEALWGAAAAVAREQGVSKTSRALGLDYYALAKRVRSHREPSRSPAFVEVAWPTVVPAPECRLELENGHGARLHVELRGAAATDVEALTRALWSAAR